ncbi:hypothetical protein [Streptomyces sp. 35G-GA-8]|uniref:hypothetical protein n=1 Tax=Streptomyces sp. 35G-GA-8 TaxID=2939434 RepID=UPI00201F42E3|nr:hypothetical protein [Streptomyces sp. 35G-GA-8]MCL7382162.1 hypothetical protein [Streptomyces sp. 35G-GA-8]
MNTSDRRPTRRVPEARSRTGAPHTPIDRAKVGRSSVRRRATGMTATEAAAALGEARLHQHIDRDREDLADDERGPAEVAEWERVTHLLAATGGTYDPKADTVVQDEYAAEAELRELEMEQQRQEWLHSGGLPERAHMLMTLEKAGLLGTTRAHHGAEGPLVLHEPEDAYALDYLNEYGEFFEMSLILEGHGMAPPRDPDAVPASVRAHSALLRAMARAGTLEGFDAGHAVRLAQADPDAVLALAAWIKASARSSR